jgi:hypothetical protein
MLRMATREATTGRDGSRLRGIASIILFFDQPTTPPSIAKVVSFNLYIFLSLTLSGPDLVLDVLSADRTNNEDVVA